jgi:hypothetical protein
MKLFTRKILDGVAAIMFLLKGQTGSFRSVLKAHIDYYRNFPQLKIKRKMVKNLESGDFVPKILNKSVIFEFYIKGNKTFKSLDVEN